MAEITLWNANLPTAVLMGAIAAGVYVLAHMRRGEFCFSHLDAFIVAAIMAAVTAGSMPLINRVGEEAKASTLKQNLYTLRSQIELYKVEHGGALPLLYEGTLPQLTEPTDAGGTPGVAGKAHPYGPYLPLIPVNPYTGTAVIRTAETFPPTAASDRGGWLYHEPTGRIVPDLAEHLRD